MDNIEKFVPMSLYPPGYRGVFHRNISALYVMDSNILVTFPKGTKYIVIAEFPYAVIVNILGNKDDNIKMPEVPMAGWEVPIDVLANHIL